MEEEKFHREERFVSMKDAIRKRYRELEEEPDTEFERKIAFEETEVFILSTANLERVKGVLTMLDNVASNNQKVALDSIEKIENLYDRLKLDQTEKYQFLSMNQVRFLLFSSTAAAPNSTVLSLSS